MESKKIFIGRANSIGKNAYKIDSIVYIESQINYSIFHFDKLSITKRKSAVSLKKWAERIEGFVRISQNYLVNPDYILKIIDNKIYLKTGIGLQFSRRKKKNMKNLVIAFLLSFLAFSANSQNTVDFSSVKQEDLILFQQKITEKANAEKRPLTTDELDVLVRINKAKFTSAGSTVSFSKVPKSVLDSDLQSQLNALSMYFNSVPQFRLFKKSLRMAYSRDTSVVTRVIFNKNNNFNIIPKEYNKEWFINLAKTND